MSERETQNLVLKAIKSFKDNNSGSLIALTQLSSLTTIREEDLIPLLRSLKALDCVRYTEDNTLKPELIDITINGKNRIK